MVLGIVDRIESLADNINIKKTDKDRQRAKRFKVKVTNFEGIVIKRLMNNTNKPFVKLEEIFDIVHDVHGETFSWRICKYYTKSS